MKFQSGDETDNAISKVILHEFSRCQFAFETFIRLRDLKYLSKQGTDKKVDILTYNSYAVFIQHLYEYFKGCVIRGRKNTSNVPYEEMDKIINREVNKCLQTWLMRIDNGIAPSWVNDRSYYEDTCPNEFGQHFRMIRNSIAHVDYRRIGEGSTITLSQFYKKYHKYVILLYDTAMDLWSVTNYEELDLGDITEFNTVTTQIL